jgi:FixJ family two-component response regulator
LNRSRPLIAVVEDADSVRKAFRRLLRSAGLSVDTYASGEEFLLTMPDRLPDCLLLDFQLPGMSGLAVQSRLRESGLTVAVVFITTTEGSEAQEQAMQCGATAWLRKPVDHQELVDTIAQALSGKNIPPIA